MTALRQSAIMELEKIPEDKLSFVIQIMQGVNGLYNDGNKERKEAFITNKAPTERDNLSEGTIFNSATDCGYYQQLFIKERDFYKYDRQ